MKRISSRSMSTAIIVFGIAACHDAVAPVSARRSVGAVHNSIQSSTTGVPMTDLGTLGGPTSQGFAINNVGQVVGTSSTVAGFTRAFLWSSDAGMREFLHGLVPDDESNSASAINDVGQVVGRMGLDGPDVWTEGAGIRGYRWSEAAGLLNLGAVDGNPTSAVGINKVGQVIGSFYTYNWEAGAYSSPNPFLWTEATGMRPLNGVWTGLADPSDINDLGQVVGTSGVAYMWTEGGGVHVLFDWMTCADATAVNNAGQVVGFIGCNQSVGIGPAGYVWTLEGGAQYLPTLGGTSTYPLDINDAAQVVGYDFTTSGEKHAFVWSEAEGMRDLGTLGGGSSEAHAINNNGQIVGQSVNAAGQTHAVLWTVSLPAPLPPPAPPAAPSGTMARPVGSSAVTVFWIDNSPNEAGFRLERSVDGGATWTEVVRTAPNLTSYMDVGLASEAPVCHRVSAFNSGGMSATSSVVCTSPPAAPTGLVASNDPANPWSAVNLSWFDNSSVEDRYEIQRCAGVACSGYAAITSVAANTTRYTDGTLSAATSYTYRVVASQGNGGSDPSNAASVSTTVDPNIPPVARFTWTCSNTSCTFDATTSTDDSAIASYSWSFGDSRTAAGPVVSHTYPARNTYAVRLTLLDDGSPPKSGSATCSVRAAKGKTVGSCY